jgi:hypothetical protein
MTTERIVLRFGSRRIVNGEVWLEAFNLDLQKTCQLVIELRQDSDPKLVPPTTKSVDEQLQAYQQVILRCAQDAYRDNQQYLRLDLRSFT